MDLLKKILTPFKLALLFVLLSVALFSYFTFFSEPTSVAATTEKEEASNRKVETVLVHRADHPLRVSLQGEAVAARRRDFIAPFSASVKKSAQLSRGMLVSKGDFILSLDTSKIDIAFQELEVSLKKLELQRKKLLLSRQGEWDRLHRLEGMTDLITEALKKQEDRLFTEKELVAKKETLYSRGAYSETEFLQKKMELQQFELDWIRSQTQAQEHELNLSSLKNKIQMFDFDLTELDQSKAQLQLQKKELKRQKDEAFFYAPYSARLSGITADLGDNVTAGEQLFSLDSADEVELTLDLPDSYLPWVYDKGWLSGSLEENPVVSITMLHPTFKKSFAGGFIKSIGESLNSPTRSLRLLVGRQNSLDTLLPGTVCEVELDLALLEDVFLIPSQALQEGNKIYYVDGDNKLRALFVEVIHRISGALICKSSTEESSIRLVPYRLKNVSDGMIVDVEEKE